MDRFNNKYRITSARAAFWDYGWNAAYFVTICTHNRGHHFGEVVNGRTNLSLVTNNACQINPNFEWQPRYRDHIIRNKKSYRNILNYIIDNTYKWMKYRFYTPKLN